MSGDPQIEPGRAQAEIGRESFGEAGDLMRQIEAKKALWETFARAAGFSMRVALEGGTHFDHQRCEVVLDISQLAEHGIKTPHDIDFLVQHELGHFIEMYSDPAGYKTVIQEGQRSDGLGGIYFRLYNCVMDVFVNTNSADRFALYRGDRERRFTDGVKELYTKKFFAGRDFQDMPFAQQFTDYLLNLGMECASDIKLSKPVRDLIEAGLTGLAGEHMSYKQFIDAYLRPVVGRPHLSGWRGTLSERKMVVDYALRPVFEELIALDKAAGRRLTGLSGEVIPGFDVDPKSLREALKDAFRRHREKSMTPEEKAAAERERQARECGEEAGLTPEQAKDFAETYERAYGPMLELAALWKRIRNRKVEYKPELRGHYLQGSELDLPKAIDDYARIARNPYTAEVMLKQHYLPSYTYQPKQLWLIIVLDLSGSMEDDLPHTRELDVALAGSFAILNNEHRDGLSPVSGALTLIGFNDSAHEILRYSESTSLKEVAGGFAKINASGGTSDHSALAEVLGMLTPERIEQIKEGNLLPVLIEITDGDTSKPQRSKRLIKSLEDLGVRAAGIRFGSGLRPDNPRQRGEFWDPAAEREELRELHERTGNFDKIWNSGDKVKGFQVWHAKDVAPFIRRYLADLIDKEGL